MSTCVSTDNYKVTIRNNGTIESLCVLPNSNWYTIPFRSDENSGPKWENVEMKLVDKFPLQFEGIKNQIRYFIQYAVVNSKLIITARLKNESASLFRPQEARFTLGINSETLEYPEWRKKYIPTLLRAEKTHLWGYFMSPEGKILSLCVDSPVASWNYHFDHSTSRILTVSLDMLHPLPLPPRHPQNQTELASSEEREWKIYLEPVIAPTDVKPHIARNINAPMIEIDRYTLAEGEEAVLTIYSEEDIDISVQKASGKSSLLKPERKLDGIFQTKLLPQHGIGIYIIHIRNQSGKISEAMIFVRHPWSWYMKQARKEAVRMPQKASRCMESWMGLFSAYLARRYFPKPNIDNESERNYKTILPVMYDVDKGEPIVEKYSRIQNTYYMISLLVDVYRATGNIEELELASRLGDWLMQTQKDDGAYYSIRNGNKHCHYTCVGYGAKSMFELVAAEKELGMQEPVWNERCERHYLSAKAAVNDLEKRLDNIGTEGMVSYEDGMIGCSATQLAMCALLQKEDDEKERYLQAARFMFNGHRCLNQMIIPDCRMNEGTLRFWEAQYDILIRKPGNMMNSPHGWSAWRIPGLYYMYLLTGEEEWLRRAINALGSCVQLIDAESGRLRWAFIPDPYVETEIFRKSTKADSTGEYVPETIGEQYLDMISDFHQPEDFRQILHGYLAEDGSCCDNDVHEVFKALEEVVLSSAYVVERESGILAAYNCKINKHNDVLEIWPSENIVSRVHFNLIHKHKISCVFSNGYHAEGEFRGMQWIGPGGIPEDLR